MTRDGLRYWVARFAIVMPGEHPIRPTLEALNDLGIGTPLAPAWDPAIADAAS